MTRHTAPRRRFLIAAVVALGLLPLVPHTADAAPKPCGTAFPSYVPKARASGTQLLADQAITMSDGTVLRVFDILQAADSRTVGGVLFGGDAFLRRSANDVFGGINDAGGLA